MFFGGEGFCERFLVRCLVRLLRFLAEVFGGEVFGKGCLGRCLVRFLKRGFVRFSGRVVAEVFGRFWRGVFGEVVGEVVEVFGEVFGEGGC